MPNTELNALKEKEQKAFEQKRIAYRLYTDAKVLTESARIVMDAAWSELCSARKEMNVEYCAVQASSDNYRTVWEEYGEIRDEKNARIQELMAEADSEHQKMKRCFRRANEAYKSGKRTDAPIFSAEGYKHRERRDELNAEVQVLIQEIKDARTSAEWMAPKTDSSAFHRARETFNAARAYHKETQDEYKRCKEERNRLKAEFDAAKAEHALVKNELLAKLDEIKEKEARKKTFLHGVFRKVTG